MLLMVFDSETNGIPDWKVPSDSPEQPHIVSFAAVLVDEETFEVEDSLELIVKPDGWSWDESCEAFQAHGITMEQALESGIDEAQAMDEIIKFWKRCGLRVAHNTTFDNRIVRIALKRYRKELVDDWKEGPHYCTAINARKDMKLPGRRNPKLVDAYRNYTGKDLVGNHDAMVDTLACLEVYKGINSKNKTQKLMGLESMFSFGKYKGQQLEDVITDDPSYIEWLIDGDVVSFDGKANDLINKKKIA